MAREFLLFNSGLVFSLINVLFVFLICNTAHQDGRKHIGDYNLRWIRPFPYRNSFNSNFVCSPHVSNEQLRINVACMILKMLVIKLTSTYKNEAY